MKTIGLEEHFVVPEVMKAWEALEPQWQDLALRQSASPDLEHKLSDLDEGRLAAMAESGMDVQVLSLTAPGVQNLAPDDAVTLQRISNDRLAEAVKAHPERLQGFATLATPAPEAAARELERAVTKLGLNGAMVFGRTRSENFDHNKYWPIFEAASALRAPLYMHPQAPQAGVVEACYSGFNEIVDAMFARPVIGWHYETGIQLIRMMLAGVFDRFPDLQIITGHWGEVVLFYLERIDIVSRVAKLSKKPSEYFQQNIMITPSGIFSQRYLRWAIEVLGAERILFSTDYPYAFAPNGGARKFLEAAQLSETDREKVASGNWERLCTRIRR